MKEERLSYCDSLSPFFSIKIVSYESVLMLASESISYCIT